MKLATKDTVIEELENFLNNQSRFQAYSKSVAQYLHELVLKQDEDFRDVTDVLHGKQLGHPLHPVLTDLTIGNWTFGVLFDVVGILTRSRNVKRTGDNLTKLGTLLAVPTAILGILDYSTIKKDAAGYGAAHGLLNGLAFGCFLLSTIARLKGNRTRAFFTAIAGMMFATASAWLGGELVYRHRVGVNHAPDSGPAEWMNCMLLDDLDEATPTRVDVANTPILLFREGEMIHAIGAVCSHAGGPLEEGTVVDEVCIQCPWHQSVYDMRDGQVIHSPSTYNQPRYEVRVRNGNVQVRRWH